MKSHKSYHQQSISESIFCQNAALYIKTHFDHKAEQLSLVKYKSRQYQLLCNLTLIPFHAISQESYKPGWIFKLSPAFYYEREFLRCDEKFSKLGEEILLPSLFCFGPFIYWVM